jgi:hypothetical protein
MRKNASRQSTSNKADIGITVSTTVARVKVIDKITSLLYDGKTVRTLVLKIHGKKKIQWETTTAMTEDKTSKVEETPGH